MRIIRTLLGIIVVGVLLWFGNSSYRKFAQDIELKNPFDVFNVQTPTISVPEVEVTHDDLQTTSPSSAPLPDYDANLNINTPSLDIDPIEVNPNIQIENNSTESEKRGITLEQLNTLISNIRVSGPETDKEYDRDLFEKPIQKYDYEGEKLTRNKYAWRISPWLIKNDESGFAYEDPYTGLIIEDQTKIDYDHIFPAKAAWEHGAYAWTDEQRNNWSYDIEVGVDVSSTSNRSKGAKMPSEWLPSANADRYCLSFFNIADKYDLSMDEQSISICKLQILNSISEGIEVTPINETIDTTETN